MSDVGASVRLTDLDAGALRDVARLPRVIEVPVVTRPFDVTIRPPGSKSLTNRALLLAALAGGASVLRHALVDAEDAAVMLAALRALGAEVSVEGETVRVRGCAGRWLPLARETTLHLENAGTATRFLTAAALLLPPGYRVVVDGSARMRERPIGELVDLLRGLGAVCSYAGRDGFPPVVIEGGWADAQRGAATPVVSVGATASSQFVSALLLLGPSLPSGIRLRFTEAVTSEPYVRMTLELLKHLGVEVEGDTARGVTVRAGRVGPLVAFEYDVESDASSAGYWWTAAAMCPGSRASVPGDWAASLQGDVGIVECLAAMGARVTQSGGAITVVGAAEGLRGIDMDLSDIPDAAMALAAACAVAKGPSTMRGLKTLRVKETDRVAALATELARVGAGAAVMEIGGDVALRITPLPGDEQKPVLLATYNDHRMAMGPALIGLVRPGVSVADPACVGKTYSRFWADLRGLFGGD